MWVTGKKKKKKGLFWPIFDLRRDEAKFLNDFRMSMDFFLKNCTIVLSILYKKKMQICGNLCHPKRTKAFSTVLLALVGADWRFIAIDVGAYGKDSDGGIFNNSNLGKSLKK